MFGSLISYTLKANDIHNIEIIEHDTYYELIISLDEVTEFEKFTLDEPHRLAIDLKDSKLKSNSLDIYLVDIVNRVRAGMVEEDTQRIVLDLDEEITIGETFFVKPDKKSDHYRLILKFQNETKTSIADILLNAPKTVEAKPEIVKDLEFTAFTDKNGFRIEYKPDYKKALAGKEDIFPYPHTKPSNFKPYMPTIVIDAGHGGKDPGAIGRSRRGEKHFNLEYAKSLAKKLTNTGKYHVVMTRTKDQFVSLQKRTDIARKNKADLFISLHADSSTDKRLQGLSVYTLSSSRAKRELASAQKHSRKKQVLQDVDLSKQNSNVRHMMITLAQRQATKDSRSFAKILTKRLNTKTKLLKKAHRHAGFKVLTGIDTPSVLIEMGYLTNRSEERKLRTKKHRDKLTSEIAASVNEYFLETLFIQ